MSCSIYRYLVVVLVLISFLVSGCRNIRSALVDTIENPHESSNCGACHVAEHSLLNAVKKGNFSGDDILSQAKTMRGGLNGVCKVCHTGRTGDHAVGIATDLNRNDLPLDNEGRITCATTCHNMHPQESGMKGYVRATTEELCLSCHDK